MKHTIKNNEHTITVTYIDELTTEDAVAMSEEAIKIVSKIDHPMNIIMDVNNGYSNGMMPIIRACAKLIKHMHHFNCCYIVGDIDNNLKYAVTFFQTVGASKDKAFFMDTLEEAENDIKIRWKHFLDSKKVDEPIEK